MTKRWKHRPEGSTWGDWGDDDQLGRLNLITPEKVKQGVAEVIASRVGIAAEKGDPLGQMKLSSRAKAQAVQRDATALLTACGLALRSFD